jgi:hypothetical protein
MGSLQRHARMLCVLLDQQIKAAAAAGRVSTLSSSKVQTYEA